MFTTLRNAQIADLFRVTSPADKTCYPAAGLRATKLGRKPY
jgi:hypothetical protein